MPQPLTDDWNTWTGGSRPVDPDALVDIRHYDGDTTLGARAGDMQVEGTGGFDWWSHDDLDYGPDGFVVAYRAAKPC